MSQIIYFLFALCVFYGTVFFLNTNTLRIHGNVYDVLNGQVGKHNVGKLDIHEMKYGLGAGTLGGLEDFGEAIKVGDLFYVKVGNAEKHFSTESSTTILTAFLATLSPNSVPSHSVLVDKPIMIQELYEELISRSSNGLIGVYGRGIFESVETTAIKVPPIYGEVLIAEENRGKYFHERKVYKNVETVFFGFISRDTRFTKDNQDLLFKRMFYRNFANAQETEEIMSHTHIGLLKEEEEEGSNKEEIFDVLHLLTQSVIRSGEIQVFPIHEVVEF